ncbi:hypothetical protein E1B28_003487 [Marasmius oreades]|uniref:Meiotically up-regulated gene 152 protein n=1 Tax=Marasmius oreades TaxID=181124 RepID=A0A9P7RM20_9AGAR|nr:uncharacterized protein E1B28_003487 [Marasmius oreades]KAG7085962.1 hypothetical protein E1B28_003487 [Marasmius oreades]
MVSGTILSPSSSSSPLTDQYLSSSSKGKFMLQPPSSSTFSFTAPLLSPSSSSTTTTTSGAATPMKLRRVSMALASSPKVVPESTWSFRDDTGIEMHVAETCLMPEKKGKLRKIAADADDDILAEKKQRKRWSPEETQMLVDGCNKHGVGNWKTILGDLEFKFDNRSPVDLKDRFRTYFPDAYKQHYPNARTHLSSKIRSTLPDGTSLFEKTRSKKRRPFTEEEDRALKAGYEKHGTVWAAIVKDPIFQEQNRRSTDLRDRFRNAYPDLYQAAGYKPRSAAKKKMASAGESSGFTLSQARMPIRAATDDQLSMASSSTRRRKRRNTSQGLLRGGTKSVPQSASPSEDEDSDNEFIKPSRATRSNSSPLNSLYSSTSKITSTSESSSPVKGFLDDDMGLLSMDTDTLSDVLTLADFPDTSHSENDAQSQAWSSGLDTPVHSHHTWAGSPASSHLSSDYLLSSQSSPFQGRNEGIVGGMGMIGKSAWGTQDWFSANPRLDSSGSTTSSLVPERGFSPASPFSFSHSHGIFDRYDLMPAGNSNDFSSEVGVGESRQTFSDEMFPPSSGFRGFTHHSDYAGDLIFGARTHQPQASSYYESGFGNLGSEGQTMGLGLSGMDTSTGINPMQLHTPALPGIDEIELTGITLDDNAPIDAQVVDDSGIDMNILHVHSPTKDDTLRKSQLPHHFHLPPPRPQSVMSETRLIFDDLVDMSGVAHMTPPGTPLSQFRQNRKRSANCNIHFSRSISVPPGERNHIPSPPSRPVQMHSNSQPEILADGRGMFKNEVPFTSDDSRMSISPSRSHRSPSPLLSSSGSLQNPPSFSSLFFASVSHLTGHQQQPVNGEHSGDNNLPFLDLHYGGMSMPPPPAVDESRNYRQALDLAQSVASSLPKPTNGSVIGPLVGQGQGQATATTDPRSKPTRMFRGRSGLPNPDPNPAPPASPSTMSPPSGRMFLSSHHRGQSAVCPQDLMLRSDNNKRKRASWDGAHLLNSAC